MGASAYKKALFSILIVPCLWTAFTRLGESGFATPQGSLEETPASPHCYGVEHPLIGSHIVCPSPEESVIGKAIEGFSLPSSCANTVLPKGMRPGDMIHLAPQGSECIFVRRDRIKGAQRLLCGGKIDINLDSVEDLKLLPAIGDVKAKLIIESRAKDGPFQKVEDLMRVRGIGEKTVEQLRPWVDFSGR